MGYTLTRLFKQHDGAVIRERRDTFEGGETYADAERQAKRWWTSAAATAGAVEASTVVEILDASGRTIVCMRDSRAGAPVLSLAGQAHPATMRWLNYLRDVGTLAEPVRRSAERLSGLGSGDPADVAWAEALDAYASRLGALIYRFDDMMRNGFSASGGDPASRLNVRRTVEETMDEADVDAYLALTMEGRIPVPPSTLVREKVPALLEALQRVSAAMLRACETIEAHAAGEDPEPALAPGR